MSAPPVTAPVRRAPAPVPSGTTRRTVLRRRLVGAAVVGLPVLWALQRSLSAGDLLNPAGGATLARLLAAAADPALDPAFLQVVLRAALTTVVFALLGTAGALVLGALGALVLSDAVWGGAPALPVRALRALLRGVLVAVRSIHELVWALLLVTVLGVDPVVGVLAIAVPFGAQTAKVFADVLDGVPRRPYAALRAGGAPAVPALAYALLPAASPLLLSYSFYRFECAIRSAVVLGVVGIGGLGGELSVSLLSRNWDEVWTLVGAVLLLSAVVETWSSRLRSDLAVASCTDWSAAGESGGVRRSRWGRASAAALVVLVTAAWVLSEVSPATLVSPRTRERTVLLLDELWPPALPPEGWPALVGGVLDTLAMAVLAMVIAVVLTVLLAPTATRRRDARGQASGLPSRVAGAGGRGVSRVVLLVLRSVPPTVWAPIALLVLFPGVLPGAVALGLYTGGILGRLVAEAWDGIDLRPRDALRALGAGRTVASLVAVLPPSGQHLVTYSLYRFEICVRDTAVVGVVGAAGLGRLLGESLAVFRMPVVSTLLVASFVVSVFAEVLGRRLRAAVQAGRTSDQ